MGRRIAVILFGGWLIVFALMAGDLLPRSQLYYFPLNIYGTLTSQIAPYQVWAADPTSSVSSSVKASAITVVPPWYQQSYQQLFHTISPDKPRTLVVCSELDNYIVTNYAAIMPPASLKRIVIFDGGHHLATLATAPQMLLIPTAGSYAAHTFMADAMSVAKIKAIIKEMGLPTIVVTAPRWAVVKCEWGLYGWAQRLQGYQSAPAPGAKEVISGSHYAISRGIALVYLADQAQQIRLQAALSAQSKHYHKLYLAFNYSQINEETAIKVAQKWSQQSGKPVHIVNRPYTVFNINR